MFRLHRHKQEKSGERIDFKFSHFHALQVPKGWDKLFVYVISVVTGKTVAKSNKAAVRNGNCQWTEAVVESIWVSQDDASKELEDRLFKFVVAMGSARSGILGEAIVNLTDYTCSGAAVAVSLPLKKCSHGTILQVKIQCLSPRAKLRAEKHWEETTSNQEDPNTDYGDVDNKSDGSDNMFTRSTGSCSSNNLVSSHGTHPGENGSRDMSFSTSRRSSDSGDSSIGRITSSPINNVNLDVYNHIRRQDSTSSQNSAVVSDSGDDPPKSNQSSFNSRITGSGSHLQNQWQEVTGQGAAHMLAPLALRAADSSKDLLEAAEATIEELRGEAKMWERNARKLKLDLEMLRKDFSDQARHQADLDMELSAVCTERDSLKLEIGQLKSLLGESMTKQTAFDNSISQAEDTNQIRKELEDEIKFQKKSNADLALQLAKTQESNLQLLSVLQELEDTIEKQRIEIEKFSSKKIKISTMLGCKLGESAGDLHEPLGMEDQSSLSLQLEKLQESEREMQTVMELLKKTVEDKNNEIEQERSLRDQAMLDVEAKMSCKLSEREEEITKLEAKLSELLHSAPGSQNTGLLNLVDVDLVKENEALRAKVQDLERDCVELTEENLNLIFEMKKTKKGILIGENFLASGSGELQIETNISPSMSDSEIFHLKSRVCQPEQQLKEIKVLGEGVFIESIDAQAGDLQTKCTKLEVELETFKEKVCNLDAELCKTRLDLGKKELDFSTSQLQLENYHVKEINWENQFSAASERIESLEKELHSKISDHDKELAMSKSEIEACETCVSFKEEEIESLRHLQRELEAQVSGLQQEKAQLEANLNVALKESSISSKSLDDVQKDLMVLTNNMDSQVSTNKMLERKLIELESNKHELELHLSELEEENVHLTERVSELDTQSRYLIDEKESSRLELERCKCLIVDLQNEIEKMGNELEMQKVELKQKLQEARRQLAGVEEESEFSKRANTKLQATIESLMEECSYLQKRNDEVRKQRLKLHEHCTHLETELRESRERFSDCSKQVEVLEEKISSMHKDVFIKEKSLTSELESLFHKLKEIEEELTFFESLLNEERFERAAECENLQREVAHLTAQILSTHDDRERMASETVLELSTLRANKTKLESSLQDSHAKIKSLETELHNLRLESENKAQELVDVLAASRRNEEMLMVENERMNRLVEDVKAGEEKQKVMLNEMQLKLKASDYERQLSAEENSSLKAQIQNLVNLQDEILALKSSLDETIYEKGKLEASLKLLSGEWEEMKAERASFIEKISSMQKVLSEGEECRRSRITLEEKLLRLESELSAKEALCAQDAEVKNELSRVKRANSQFQRKIQCLEEEKDECLRRAQALEEELQLMKEDRDLNHERLPESPVCNDISFQQHVLEVDKMSHNHEGRSQTIVESDLISKIQLLETELAEALEANSMYKMQLKSHLLCVHDNSHGGDIKNSAADGGYRNKDDLRINSSLSLEAELRDMRERYFHMSLKYAEVEAQREELLMKMKSLKTGKRWFSMS